MADELGDENHVPKLEELCVKFIRKNVNCWKPEEFLGIPRHLLYSLVEKLHPFEVEKLQVSGIFKSMGIDTNPLWRDFYSTRWPRKSKWPGIYFNMKGISREQEQWRVYYLQRHLQEALNSHNAVESCSSSEGSQSLQNIVSVCGKYAAYLRLYNPACVYLAKKLDICLQLAEYVEFLEVFLLRDSGVDSLCCLLQVFGVKRLKSVGFWFCKVDCVQMWRRIFSSLSQINHQKGCSLTDLAKNLNATETTKALTRKSDKSYMNQICNQLDYKKDLNTTSKGTPEVHASDITTENLHVNCGSFESSDELDIYEFTDGYDNCHLLQPCRGESGVELSRSCDLSLNQSGLREITADISSDLYDEVFGCWNCRQSCAMPKELCVLNETQHADSTSEQYQIMINSEKLQTPLTGLSNLECPLVHFELIAFPLHPDILELFLNSLEHWLNLESLSFEDNGLGLLFLHTPLSQKFVDALFFLCRKGRLQSLEITNDLVGNDVANSLIEKLVSSFCDNCDQDSKSLVKLKFSSYQASTAFAACLGKAIRDVCAMPCESRSHSHTAEFPESSLATESKEEIRGLLQVAFTEQSCSFCERCHRSCTNNCDVGRRKTTASTSAFDPSVTVKILESVSSKCDSSTNSKDRTVGDCNINQACKCNAVLHVSGNNDSDIEKPKAKCARSTFCDKSMCEHTLKARKEPGLPMTSSKDMPVVHSSEDLSQNSSSFTAWDVRSAFVGIQELRLTCPIWDRGASLIADGLRANSSLHSLSLANCDIATAGLADIFQALSGNRFLKHLCVKGNSYDSGNNDSLAEMLASNKTLTDLNLSSCKLGEHVTELSMNFIHALCINSTLTSLKLKNNRLGDAHITALSQVFSHPSQLSRISKLDLSNNPISLECLSHLASSLQCRRPRKLDELKITGNILGPKSHQVLSSLRSVVHNVTAEHLDKATLFADFISQM